MGLELKNVTKKFKTIEGERVIFENLNIHFPDYGLIAITGESGCGKSTLLQLIAGLDQDYEGKILFNQVKIEDIKDYRQLVISFVYQNYQLIDYLSVKDNCLFYCHLKGIKVVEKQLQEFLDGLALCRKYNLEVCVHIINGLPFETKEMMIETAKTLGQLDIQALKIHMLFVVKNTKLQQMYENHEFNMLSRQEYIDIVVEQLRYIKPEIVIERLTGDGKIDDLIAPLWSIKKVTILNDIDKKMKELDVYQGDLYKK
jgi:ABC-type sugar transport system ATPase subunit